MEYQDVMRAFVGVVSVIQGALKRLTTYSSYSLALSWHSSLSLQSDIVY